MAELALEHLSKHYPGVMALDDLSLTVADGELLVLVGPSGCGKTTTLRLIAGLEHPTSGTIRIGSRCVNPLPPRQRNVALVFQRPALYPHLSVEDNLAFGARLRQGSGTFRRWLWRWLCPDRHVRAVQEEQTLAAQVAGAAQALGLTGLLQRRPDQLSGGEQQRVALGRALVRRPDLFLFDEPLSNLDPGLRNELRRELHLLQRRLRATMIYVTHDQVEALTLGDRVAVLDRGKLQQVGRPLDVYERPANRFVAGFIGWPPMNFVDVTTALRPDGGMTLLRDGVSFPLSEETARVKPGQDITVGLRPDQVCLPALGDVRVGDNTRGVGMEVLLVEPVGPASLVTLERNGWQLVAQVDGRSRLHEGQTVEVILDMRRAHGFDRSSGVALFHGVPSG
jgi:multiple sugar transport system ATP-binding protein